MNLLEMQKRYQEENKKKEEMLANNAKDKSEIELEKLIEFREGQPFSIYNDSEKEQMKESIKRNGVINPIVIRKIDENKYEILSGHNRVQCSRELGLRTIPCIIKECNDNGATLIMIDSNLCNREKILPVEKGYAYKRKNSILKNECNLSSLKGLCHDDTDSRSMIFRYIKLTDLIKQLQNKVNGEDISIMAGVELSYLSREQQELVNRFIEDRNMKISLGMAKKMRMLKNSLNYEMLENIVDGKNVKDNRFTGKLDKSTIKKYKDKFNNDREFVDLIQKLLDKYFEE